MSYIKDINSARFNEAYSKYKKSRDCNGEFLHVFTNNERRDKLFYKMYHLHLMGTDLSYRSVVLRALRKSKTLQEHQRTL